MDYRNESLEDSYSGSECEGSSYAYSTSNSRSSCEDFEEAEFDEEGEYDEEAEFNEEAGINPLEVFEKKPTSVSTVNDAVKVELPAVKVEVSDERAGEASCSCTNDLQFQTPLEVSLRGLGQPSRGIKRSRETDVATEMDVEGELKAATPSADPLSRPKITVRQVDVHSETGASLFTSDQNVPGFSWTGISSFAGQKETFLPERSGPTARYETAYDSFRAIWTDEILDLIVVETNRYAMNVRRRDRLHLTWRDTDRNEILVLFTFFLMLGNIRMPSLRSCYASHWMMKTDVFKNLLSYERFLELTRCFRFFRNDGVPTSPRNTKRSNVWPVIINLLNAKFQELYVPSQNISIYESQTLWFDQLGVKTHTNITAAKYGLKTFELCDSGNSYLWSFIVDKGDRTSFVDSYLKSTSMVLSLTKPLLNKGYTLWMDSQFNSPLLARYLKQNKTDCAGTLDTKKANVPPAFDRFFLANGQCFGRHAGDVALLSWRVNEQLTTISTYHGAEMEFGPSRGGLDVYEPKVFRDYNKYTEGIDRKDQLLGPYLREDKSCRKWPLQLFKRLLNMSIHNSFVIYRQSSEMSNMVFRFVLARELVDRHLELAQLRVPREPTLTDSFSNPARLIPGNHFPMSNLPSTDSQTDQIDGEHPALSPQNGCAWCSNRNQLEKMTNYMCKLCKVPLCIEPCFEYYHSCN